MKLFCSLLFFFLVASSNVFAQQNHFLFVQSETRQPFNITLNKKVYSSTATGYLIIPKLSSGQYDIEVGFGQNTYPDQHFIVEIKQKDVGFNLKNFSEKGWGLFNLQTMDLTMSKEAQQSTGLAITSQANSFTSLTNQPAKGAETFQPEIHSSKPAEQVTKQPGNPNNTGVQSSSASSDKQSQASAIEVKAATTSPAKPLHETTDKNVVNAQATENKTESGQQEVAEKPAASNQRSSASKPLSRITKISEMKGGEAIYMTYVDITEAGADTIDLLIPSATIATEKSAKNSEQQGGLKFLDIEARQSAKSKQQDNKSNQSQLENVASVNAAPEARSSACSSVATKDDFLRLRKKMAAASDNDAMVYEARKAFKGQCFTTEQVKNLAYLFLSDDARYQFFDAAYPFVSDPANFPPLAIMLSNDYYINRFKTMLRN